MAGSEYACIASAARTVAGHPLKSRSCWSSTPRRRGICEMGRRHGTTRIELAGVVAEVGSRATRVDVGGAVPPDDLQAAPVTITAYFEIHLPDYRGTFEKAAS